MEKIVEKVTSKKSKAKKFAVVLCGGKSERFESDKMSSRLFSGSVSRVSVEKFCDFDLVVCVLPAEKLIILRDIVKYLKDMAKEKATRTLTNQLRTDLDSGILRTRKPEITDLFYENYQFPQVEFDLYVKKRNRRKKPMLWDEKTARLVFWEMWELAWLKMNNPKIGFVIAGDTRTKSVENGIVKIMQGLKILPENAVIAIHDGARPFVTREQIAKTVTSARRYGSGVLAIPARDTMRKFKGKILLENVDRDVVQIQTPQTFDMGKLLNAYAKVEGDFTDDSQVYSEVYGDCRFVEGGISNFKITYPSDISGFSHACGFGYDVHQLSEGKKFVLGGVEFDHTKGMVAHSDGDVLIHAICDAILSSVGEKDIGHHFPDTDAKFAGIDSKILLEKCVEILGEKGGRIANITTMIMAEKPKIAPKIDEMKEVLASLMKINTAQISISATTTEKLGIVGEERGVACCAFVLVN